MTGKRPAQYLVILSAVAAIFFIAAIEDPLLLPFIILLFVLGIWAAIDLFSLYLERRDYSETLPSQTRNT